MEEKKFDFRTLFAFVLIFGILLWIMYQNQPTPEEVTESRAQKQEQVDVQKNTPVPTSTELLSTADLNANDSLRMAQLQNSLGSFAYSGTLSEEISVLENEVLRLEI